MRPRDLINATRGLTAQQLLLEKQCKAAQMKARTLSYTLSYHSMISQDYSVRYCGRMGTLALVTKR